VECGALKRQLVRVARIQAGVTLSLFFTTIRQRRIGGG